MTEAGLVVPEKEPVPLAVQLVKLWPMACAAIVQIRATQRTSHKASFIYCVQRQRTRRDPQALIAAYGVGVGVGDALTTVKLTSD